MRNPFIGVMAVIAFLLAGYAALNTSANQLSAQAPQVTDGGCYFLNGVHRCPTEKAFNSATTTVCAIQAPKNATSTLSRDGSARFKVSSTTASTVTIAKASTPYATTTVINEVAVSANAQATILTASSSISSLEQTNRTFAPGQYLVFSMAGGTGTFSPTGACSAEFVY